MSGQATSCYNGSNGQATVSISSLNTCTVSWSTGASTNTITGLSAGTYTVIVQDQCTGCSVTGAYVVNSPNPLAINATIIDVPCKGQSTGQIQLQVTGGTPSPGYSYDWDYNGFGSFTDPQSPFVAAGVHTVKVKDSKGCILQESYFVDEPQTELSINYNVTDVSCNGGTNGAIDLIMNGSGTPPYSFNWPTLGTSEDVSNLPADTYDVTVTDYNGCTTSASIVVNQPNTPLSSNITATPNIDVSCFGLSDGEISTYINGGTAPYNYVWSNSTMVFSSNSDVLSNIPSDVYSVLVTDANGCTITDGATINQPTPLEIVSAPIQNVECFGENTGQVTVNVIGGNGGYNYAWTNSSGMPVGGNSNVISTLIADDYTVTITDSKGCEISATYSVTEPASPVSIIVNGITDVLCYGMNTGGVNISATGGTPGYTYNWYDATSTVIATTEDLTGQYSGDYSVTVADIYGCDSTMNFTIIQPQDTLIATHTMTPVVCYGESNGTVDVNTTGGTAPYSYEWTNSTYQLSTDVEDLINFPSDLYYLTITDIHNCVYTDTFYITQPDLLTGTTVGVDILCKYDATGEIDLTMQGGIPSYLYQWTNSTGTVVGTTEDLMNLVADTYDLLVTDANLCSFETSVTLTEPDDTLGFAYTSYPVICHGEDNGYIELEVFGGTPAYSILWSTTDTLATITDLTAGWYEFTVTDDHGCQVSDSIEVLQPDLLLANEVVTDVTCNGFSDGIIDISPTGGTGPYSYTWFNSQYALSAQTQDLIDFPADIYQLELRDSLGCLTELFIDLPEPEPLVITAVTVDVTCAGGSDGSIDITVTGGNPGYTYQWTNGYTTEDLINVPVDEYTVQVTDTKNCLDSLTIIIYEPDSITVEFEVLEVSCADQHDGSILAMPSGGTGTFTFLWSNGGTDEMIDNLYGGTYIVTVTDIVGCEMSDTTFVPTNPKACINPPNAFTPNGDLYNDTWFLENSYLYPDIDVKIFNRWGNLLYQQQNMYEPWDGTNNGDPVPSETYYYIINLNNESEPFKGFVTIVR